MNNAAKQVVDYLKGLASTGCVAGQFGSKGGGQTVATANKQLADIKALTGKDIGFTGMDYVMEEGRAAANRYLIDQWKHGLIVTLSWHAPNPWTGGKSDDIGDQEADITEENHTNWRARTAELLNPATTAGKTWTAMLKEIADSLTELRDAGVPVLWRPLHEMNGGWFWWTPAPDGNDKPQPAVFIALWRQMHDYLTNVRALDNLIWTYSPNVCDRYRATPNVFYPGDAYVDVVGLDKYRNLGEEPLTLNAFGEYDQLVATGKPVGLCEFGPIPSTGKGWNTEKYDWATLARDLRGLYPRIVFFSAWEGVWSIPHKPTVGQRGLMNDVWVRTLDKLPKWDVVVEPPPVDPPPTPTLDEAAVRRIVDEAISARLAQLGADIAALLSKKG